EFLHPINSVMDETDFSAHLTTGGDLIIMSKAGLLATRRNRKWKIYDLRTFKNSLAYCLGSHYAGANLFELVADHILNTESIISDDYRRKALGSSGLPPKSVAGAASAAGATVGPKSGPR